MTAPSTQATTTERASKPARECSTGPVAARCTKATSETENLKAKDPWYGPK